MKRILRRLIFAGVGLSLAVASGCSETSAPPKSFSQNVTLPQPNQPGKATGKAAQKLHLQNRQVRSFTVPQD